MELKYQIILKRESLGIDHLLLKIETDENKKQNLKSAISENHLNS
jgi:hypothetical protein